MDESIDNVHHEVEVIENAAGNIIIIAVENLKEAGRAITYPVRYVKNKTAEVVDAAGRRINYAVSSTRNAAGNGESISHTKTKIMFLGDVVEGAARGLHRAGSTIKGTSD